MTWKTAREIPDGLFRRAKSVGAERGAPYAHLAGLADRLPADQVGSETASDPGHQRTFSARDGEAWLGMLLC